MVLAHSFAVAPVVKISSKTAIFAFGRILSGIVFEINLGFIEKALVMFNCLFSLLRVLWATIFFCLIKILLK